MNSDSAKISNDPAARWQVVNSSVAGVQNWTRTIGNTLYRVFDGQFGVGVMVMFGGNWRFIEGAPQLTTAESAMRWVDEKGCIKGLGRSTIK